MQEFLSIHREADGEFSTNLFPQGMPGFCIRWAVVEFIDSHAMLLNFFQNFSVFFEHGVSLLVENFESRKGGIESHGNCFQRQLSAYISEWLLGYAFAGFLRL